MFHDESTNETPGIEICSAHGLYYLIRLRSGKPLGGPLPSQEAAEKAAYLIGTLADWTQDPPLLPDPQTNRAIRKSIIRNAKKTYRKE